MTSFNVKAIRNDADDDDECLIETTDKRVFKLNLTDGALVQQDVVVAAATVGTELRATVAALTRTSDTGSTTMLHLKNNTLVDLRMIWMSHDGTPRSYGLLPALSLTSQQTFVHHVWRIVLERDHSTVVHAFEADESPDQWICVDSLERSVVAVAPNDHVATDEFLETILSVLGGGERFDLDWQWSNDLQLCLVVARTIEPQRQLTLIESTPTIGAQPIVRSIKYEKAGDRRPAIQLVLFDRAARIAHKIGDVFATAFDLTDVHWSDCSTYVTFLHNHRGHQRVELLKLDVATRQLSAVAVEFSNTFVFYRNIAKPHCVGGDLLLWLSESSGFAHLHLIDARDGTTEVLTSGTQWSVREIVEVDEQRARVFFTAQGRKSNPYWRDLCAVGWSDRQLVVFTSELDGDVYDFVFSADLRFVALTTSSATAPPTRLLIDSLNGRRFVLHSTPLLPSMRLPQPMSFYVHGCTLFGLVVSPREIREPRRLIEKQYCGPHDSHVPTRFDRTADMQELADATGAFVCMVDSRGTANRGKQFHDACFKNVAHAGLPERVAWLQHVATALGADPACVGVFGGSAGAQTALMSLLMRPDVYAVAVCDCGCYDNRLDKQWWNEAWFGVDLADPCWDFNSCAKQAHRLADRARLLLTVGELDKNVDPASTLQVVHGLVAADKLNFEMFVAPSQGHGCGESAHLKRRRIAFFETHLWAH
jgi:dipeptidyl-peptidase-4